MKRLVTLGTRPEAIKLASVTGIAGAIESRVADQRGVPCA